MATEGSDAVSRAGKRQPSERLMGLISAQLPWLREWLPHCEPLVRRLAGDLPDFDTVWLDAFVQQRLITPWQADQLQREPPGPLKIGQFTLVEARGRHSFAAVSAEQVPRQVVITAAGQQMQGHDALTTQLIKQLVAVSHLAPSCCRLPTQSIDDGNHRTWLVTPQVPGWSLRDLLIRGGRFPWQAVQEIGRELLRAVAWLQSHKLYHSELVAENVRITPAGEIVLVSVCDRLLRNQHSQLRSPENLKQCGGTAPHACSGETTADARDELYALGCLLWQLLTGRRPFPTADPVRHQLLQQQSDVPDVRELAPECPLWMANQIHSMTRRKPELRPASANDSLQQWTGALGQGRTGVRKLIAQLPDRPQAMHAGVPRKPRRSPSGLTAAASLLLLLLTIPFLLPLGTPAFLNVNLSPFLDSRSGSQQPAREQRSASLLESNPLPVPDENGDIRLTGGLTYHATSPLIASTLRVISDAHSTARISVPATGWSIEANSVLLSGLEFVSPSTSSDSETTALVSLTSSELTVEQCVFHAERISTAGAGLRWNPAPAARGRIVIRNTWFTGNGYALSCTGMPAGLSMTNVLLASRGGGILCESSGDRTAIWSPELHRVTQRFGFSVLDLIAADVATELPEIRLSTRNCVFAPTRSVIRLLPCPGTTGDGLRVSFAAHPDSYPPLKSSVADDAVWIDRSLGRPIQLAESQISENMLLPTTLEFAAPQSAESSGIVTECQLLDFDGPKLFGQMPGIDPASLPGATMALQGGTPRR